MTKQEREELRWICTAPRHHLQAGGAWIHAVEAVPKLLDALDAQDERIKELEGKLSLAWEGEAEARRKVADMHREATLP